MPTGWWQCSVQNAVSVKTNLYPSYGATKNDHLHQAALAMRVEGATKTASTSQCEPPYRQCEANFQKMFSVPAPGT